MSMEMQIVLDNLDKLGFISNSDILNNTADGKRLDQVALRSALSSLQSRQVIPAFSYYDNILFLLISTFY
jgi:hypothetical protein